MWIGIGGQSCLVKQNLIKNDATQKTRQLTKAEKPLYDCIFRDKLPKQAIITNGQLHIDAGTNATDQRNKSTQKLSLQILSLQKGSSQVSIYFSTICSIFSFLITFYVIRTSFASLFRLFYVRCYGPDSMILERRNYNHIWKWQTIAEISGYVQIWKRCA